MTTFDPEMKETLRLMYVHGCKFKEIAEDLGVSILAARSIASRMGLCARKVSLKPYRKLSIGEAEVGLSQSQASKWVAKARRDGLKLKRFVKGNSLGLKRIA